MTARRSILTDNYKPRAIEIYDCRSAPFIDHYRFVYWFISSANQVPDVMPRLRVPFYGAILEFLNFAVLLLTFVLCLSSKFHNLSDMFALS